MRLSKVHSGHDMSRGSQRLMPLSDVKHTGLYPWAAPKNRTRTCPAADVIASARYHFACIFPSTLSSNMSLLSSGGRIDEKGSYNGRSLYPTPKHNVQAQSNSLDLEPLLNGRDREEAVTALGSSSSQGQRRTFVWALQLLCASMGGAVIALCMNSPAGHTSAVGKGHRHDRVPGYPPVEIPSAQAPYHSEHLKTWP